MESQDRSAYYVWPAPEGIVYVKVIMVGVAAADGARGLWVYLHVHCCIRHTMGLVLTYCAYHMRQKESEEVGCFRMEESYWK